MNLNRTSVANRAGNWPIVLLLIAFFLYFVKSSLLAQPVGFSDNLYLGGWDEAAGFTWDNNGRMYVWERKGKVWVVVNGVKQATPLLDISEEVGGWRDFGLLGFALDPNFITNGYIYLFYVVDRHHLLKFGTPQYNPATNEYFNATIGRITRYQVNISNYNAIVANSRFVLLGTTVNDGPPILHESHGTGSLAFGQDGTLLATMGDGASYNAVDQGSDPETYWSQAITDGIITSAQNVGAYRCQMLTSYSGKILRLDPATGEGLPSNPFFNPANPKSVASRTWGVGVRNPYRMVHRPETGSHNPADGNPGVFLLGDVGWGTREELDVVLGPEMNFGWPKFEGMTFQPGYNNAAYAPAIHHQPRLDWRTGSARGLVNGAIVNVGSAQLPGNSFTGNASTGGVWYHGHDFPAAWHDSYFHADYGAGWIKNIRFDANYNPIEVKNFVDVAGACVFLNTHPTQGGLWYVRWPDQIRRVTFTGTTNHAPVAFASANATSGTSPLTVSFSSFNTYDQDGGTLAYLWNFGDGTTSTEQNPVHTFNSGGSSPTGYTVTLTVTDLTSLTGQASLQISLNNSPPDIVATSVDAISTFNPSQTTPVSLSATVSDANHSAGQLSYLWEVLLYHNEHNHPVQSFTSATATVNLTPVECYNASYWYQVRLKVSDPTGASDFYQKDIFPACAGSPQTLSFSAIPDKLVGDAPFTISATASSGLPVIFYVTEGPATVLGNTVTLLGVPGKVTIVATQPGNGTVGPATNVQRSFMVNVTPPSNCSGTGTISFEKWTNVTGTAVSQIPITTTPNQTGTLNIFEIPVNAADNYGTRVRGFVCPPVTGQYRFWIASDDNGQLWLSTNSDPANKQLIASVGSWTNSQEWTKLTSQQSALITLNAGQQYYIEALQKEGTGGDNLAVGWQLPGGALERPIPGYRLLPFSTAPQNQTITFPALANKLTTDPPFAISATASSGLPVSFQIVSGPATVSGNTITLTGQAGTVTVRATQAGTPPSGGQGGWNAAAPVDRSFTVTQQGGGVDLSLSVTTNPATASIYNSIGYTFTVTNNGTSAASNVRVFVPLPNATVYVGGNEWTSSQGTFDHQGAKVWYVGSLAAGGNATLTVNWYLLAAPPFTGWAEVSASDQTDPDSTPGNGTPGVANEDDEAVKTVLAQGQGPQNQTITFPAIPNKESDDPPFTLSATASSGLAVSYLIVSGPATVSGNTVTLTGQTGTVTVRASQAGAPPSGGQGGWNAAPPVERSFLVTTPGLQNQTIAFSNIPNKLTADPPFTISATASSGLPVSFALVGGPATVSGNTVTLTGQPGTVTIRATQPGSAQYNPATPVDRSFTVSLPGGGSGVDLELTMGVSPATVTQWGNLSFTATLTNAGTAAASGVKVHFPKPASVVYVGGSEATVSKGSFGLFTDEMWTVGSMNPGESATITVMYFVLQNAPVTGFAQVSTATPADNDSTPGNGTSPSPSEDDEAAATAGAPGSGPQDQTINFTAIPNKVTTDPAFTLTATATSGLPVSFALVGGPATLSGNTVTLTGQTGTVTVRATQAGAPPSGGQGGWNAAPPVDRSFTVSAPGLQNQTINFAAIPNKVTTDPAFTLTATATSGLPVSFALVSGPATLSGNTVTLTGQTGTVTLRASQAGNTQYNPAPDVLRSFGVTAPGGSQPDLEVELTGSGQVLTIWQNVTFTVTVTNVGTAAASGVKLAVPIPQGTAHTNNTPPTGTSYDLFTQEWTVGNLDVGQSKTFTIVLFCLRNTVALPYFVQVKAASPADADSSPNNNSTTIPAEDDEAVWTLSPPPSPIIGVTGEAFSFFAKQVGATASLRWSTNSGAEVVRYLVERSADGYRWELIAEQQNDEPTDRFFTYRLSDDRPLPGWNFYRVVQLRQDGRLAFSNVQMVEFWDDLEEFKLFPNPAGDYVDVNLRAVEGEIVRLLLVDRTGRLVREAEVEAAPLEPVRLDLTEVPEGWYVVWVQAAGHRAVALPLVVRKF